MRVRRHDQLRFQTVFVVLLCLVPFAFVGLFLIGVQNIYHETAAWNYEVPPPDPATLTPANYSRLAEMAEFYDQRFEQFHIPLNFTVDTVFTGTNLTNVSRYSYSDNAGLWTGSSMAGWVFKYVAAKREGDETMAQDALRVIRKLTYGLAMMVAVPNGGLGPDFPGKLARGFAPPGTQDIAKFFFNSNSRHHNGTDGRSRGGQDYSQWRWRAHTSNDEYGGYYMGIGLVLKYVDDPYCQALVHLVVDQLAADMLRNNFLGIDAHGGPTGVDQKAKFLQGGGFPLLLLKMAAVCYPEKYERFYYNVASEEMWALMAKDGGETEVVANYYAYHFTTCVVFTLLLLEQDGQLAKLYNKYYLEGMHKFTATHRNLFFNYVYLATQKSPGDDEQLERDCEDQLMRFQINHFPDVANGTLPIPEDYGKVTVLEKWGRYLSDPNRYGSLFLPLVPEIDFGDTFYNKPLSVEYRMTGIFMWNDNPFKAGWSYNDTKFEFSGASFTVPYWIGRAFGFIKPSGLREAWHA
ncbi:MAG: hypothetical protein ACTSU5_10410 [Promethearchaeota archaeon]